MAARTFIRQDTQIRNSDVYTDTIAPSEAAFETNPTHIEADLNNLRSQTHNLLNNQAGNWWDDLNVPSTLETGLQRGVNDLNDALHLVEKKRVLREVHNLTDVTVGAGDNFVILGTGELPSNTTAAVGATATLGTVTATHTGTFGTHSLDEVAGSSALTPKNLSIIVAGDSRDPILSAGRQVYGLFQGESGLTDGGTITDTTPTRVQISFVRFNANGDDLEAVPVSDIQGQEINYSTRERVRLEDLNEEDFLSGAIVDVGAGAGTIDRQTAYDTQGTLPVDVTTNATLDLEAPGIAWAIRDDAEANLFRVVEGSAGGTSVVEVSGDTDTFDVDAATNDFLNGISVDTGVAGTTINLGVTANQIDVAGFLQIQSGGGANLELQSDNDLKFTDTYRAGSTWGDIDGIPLARSAQNWSDFETLYGETSLMEGIIAAGSTSQHDKIQAVVTANVSANNDVSGPANDNNLDVNLGDLAAGTFTTDYDFYTNGILQRNGANAAANEDVYPGTSLSDGQIRFEYNLKAGGNPDVITVIKWV